MQTRETLARVAYEFAQDNYHEGVSPDREHGLCACPSSPPISHMQGYATRAGGR